MVYCDGRAERTEGDMRVGGNEGWVEVGWDGERGSCLTEEAEEEAGVEVGVGVDMVSTGCGVV